MMMVPAFQAALKPLLRTRCESGHHAHCNRGSDGIGGDPGGRLAKLGGSVATLRGARGWPARSGHRKTPIALMPPIQRKSRRRTAAAVMLGRVGAMPGLGWVDPAAGLFAAARRPE
jgi:hypothetical protein